MTPSSGTARVLVIERPSGSVLHHPVTAANLLQVIERLAPLMPPDSVWYTSPITPRR